jgi:predicted ATPase/DNA-binding SARP family transcriptional activator
MLEVRFLGTFEVKYKQKPIQIASRPAQSLFAYLILNAGVTHRREKLAGLLWPDSLEETARDNLRHALWRLRKALPSNPKTEYLLVNELSIVFNASSDYWLDAAPLEKLDDSASIDELKAVFSDYQGELLPGFYDEWVVLEREHLYSLFEQHMARLMSLLQAEKRWLDILDWGERWIKLGQKPEPAYCALMSAHAAKGDMSKVAVTYQRCVKSLKEFGVEPSRETKELYERLKAGTLAPARAAIAHVPAGTVTFLFTDIEGSSRLAQAHPNEWETLLGRHHAILRESIESNNGYLFQIVGDGFCAAFHTPNDALHAAVQAQQKLQTENWGIVPIKVRMGIHTGEAEVHDQQYRGYFTLSLVQRLMSAGHGRQILLSHATENLLRGHLPKDVNLLDLGEQKFKDILQPVRVFQVLAPELQEEFPALRALNVFPNNLPIQLTSFIGREKELVEVVRLLGKHRLVTLTGPGGVGKTRLAIQSSNELLGKFKDGVWWVELASLPDAALVPQAVAQVLGVRESASQPLNKSLKDFLREKQLLLVLDNCEHLILTSAQFAVDLLSHCANLRILTTSREALGITGEMVHPVPTLSFPPIKSLTLTGLLLEYESIRLFVERAGAVKSDFALTDQNAAGVLQICQRLDGISLAIELAAARTRLLSAEQIAERLNDRFNLLTQGSRTALPRHQTLRAAIDWSHNLLTETEQILFRRLAIFIGGFTLEAVEFVGVGGDVSKSQVADLLGQLIDKSVVTVRAGLEDSESETRYGMLETIREYAREKLDESGETEHMCQRHRDYFIALAKRAEPKLKGGEQFRWLDRLELENDNLRAAWECAIESEAELALRLASALLDFWSMRGNPSEGREWLARLLPRTNHWGQTTKRAQVLSTVGFLAYLQADLAAARALLAEALPIFRAMGDSKETAFVLLWIGRVAYLQHDEPAAKTLTEECLRIYQDLKDQWGMAIAIYQLATLAVARGHYDEAEEGLMKSLAKFQELGDRHRTAYVLNALGELARLQGDYERAGEFYEKDIEMLREQRVWDALQNRLWNLAWVLLHRGDYRQARALLEEVLNIAKDDNNQQGMMGCLSGFGAILAIIGKPEQAAQLFDAVVSWFQGIGVIQPWEVSDQKEFDHYVAAVRDQLDEAAFAKAWAKGRTMTLEQAIEFALKETNQ